MEKVCVYRSKEDFSFCWIEESGEFEELRQERLDGVIVDSFFHVWQRREDHCRLRDGLMDAVVMQSRKEAT